MISHKEKKLPKDFFRYFKLQYFQKLCNLRNINPSKFEFASYIKPQKHLCIEIQLLRTPVSIGLDPTK